jgi:hypothetical protein
MHEESAMIAKPATPLLFFALVGCAAQPAVSAAGASPRGAWPEGRALSLDAPALGKATSAPASTPPSTGTAPPPVSQLGLAAGSWDEERQIAVLEEAIGLYLAFLERADGRPELEPAVVKSRERIEDARATIAFLEAGLRAKREGATSP